ncbi:MAG TPA: hypothetical protein VGP47_02210 [Parachlamydiaceae bacterium]|nr:hypothetical protein [Parachlamydiaceae bacterium]
MTKNAEDFTKEEYTHEYILNYIIDVLNAKSFIENPRKYIVVWKQNRRTCETYMHAEDVAIAFFDKYFPKSSPKRFLSGAQRF